MGKVIMNAAVSLDGYVAFGDNSVGSLFDYYGNGDVTATFVEGGMEFHVMPPTADYIREIATGTGACVIGRVLFDCTNGWNGEPAAGDHVLVVTHEVPADWPHLDSAPFTFVTEGVEAAIAQARQHCGDRDISITAGDIGGQALAAGLVDEVALNLVPAVLGSDKPFFGTGAVAEPLMLENPRVIEGDRVTHPTYPVRRSSAPSRTVDFADGGVDHGGEVQFVDLGGRRVDPHRRRLTRLPGDLGNGPATRCRTSLAKCVWVSLQDR